MKKIGMVALLLASSFMYMGVAYAKGNSDMKELLSDHTNLSVEEIEASGKRLGEIALEKGVSEEFMTAKKQAHIARVNEKLEEGVITKEEAASMIDKINSKTDCDQEKMNLKMGR